MCSHVVYDQEHVGNSEYKLQFTAYAAVVDEKAVCQGYALLLYRMMLEANVDSRLIPGTGNGEAHGWNIVKLDGQYYNVDSTWDAGKTEYKFFLKCEKTFENHVRDDEYSTNEFQEAYPMAEEDYVNRIVNLEAPTIVSVYSRNQTSVKVTWDMKEEADGYELYRAEEIESDTANWNLVKTIRKESMESFMKDGNIQYTNQGLEIGKTYYYKVRAYRLKEETLVDSEENRTYSDFSEVSYMPAAVVYDKVYSNSTSRIRMIWKQV
ncbi:MAG: hypothetical protein Q4B72_15590, partial [Lachnospiraceae bacterium]|nr:hypothetical protein [Lachnospiraceae bacterium]